ncbi:MAG: hypothetical protein ACLTDV_01715 [Eubacterium sp.]
MEYLWRGGGLMEVAEATKAIRGMMMTTLVLAAVVRDLLPFFDECIRV